MINKIQIKNEAIRRMEKLGLHKDIIINFKNDKLNISFKGDIYEMSND